MKQVIDTLRVADALEKRFQPEMVNFTSTKAMGIYFFEIKVKAGDGDISTKFFINQRSGDDIPRLFKHKFNKAVTYVESTMANQ